MTASTQDSIPAALAGQDRARAATLPLLDAGRDRRLDFWRGLCLVDMVIVHLVYEGVVSGKHLAPILGEFTRFAAGGFIFLAGLAVSYIFLKKARDDARRWGTYCALWRRSLYLLLVHYAASLSFIFIYPLRDYDGAYPNPLVYLRNVLLFREGSDLLIFYVIMMAMAPAMLELIRRGYAWALAILSLSLFTLGQWYPYVLSLPIQQGFMVILWQLIFIAGMLAGAALPWYDTLRIRAKVTLAGIAWVLLALVSWANYGGWGWRWGMSFVKCPLSPGEAIRYLLMISTIMLTSNLAWRWIAGGGIVAFFSRLGRKSLAVYIAHVWVVAMVLGIARRFSFPGRWQVSLIALAVVLLWAWTFVLDRLGDEEPSKRKAKQSHQPLVSRGMWRITGAASLGVTVIFAVHTSTVQWPGPAMNLAQLAPPANLAGVLADATDNDPYDADDLLPPMPPSEDASPDDAAV